jgi:hypothetical protein
MHLWFVSSQYILKTTIVVEDLRNTYSQNCQRILFSFANIRFKGFLSPHFVRELESIYREQKVKTLLGCLKMSRLKANLYLRCTK